MRSILLLLFVIVGFSTPGLVLGQGKNQPYSLRGVVNRDTGTVTLLPTGGQAFDPNPANPYQATIREGHFLLEGQLPYPGSYVIRIDQDYVSSEIILEAGSQTITCNADSLREVPTLATTAMAEQRLFRINYVQPHLKKREEAFKEYQTRKATITDVGRLDSLQVAFQQQRARLIHQQQRQFLDYVRQHPNSYVALWHLVNEMGAGYQPVFDSINSALSVSLRNTRTGKTIAQRLTSSKVTAPGQIFPSLTLVDMDNKVVPIASGQRPSYTLIDLWFSHCGPCLREFPDLKDIFARYEAKGFSIIGISIDKPADTETWKKMIRAQGLRWPQYLDASGQIIVGQLSINYFPSNFLLDEKGTIIRKNISPLDLRNFLSQRL